MIALAAVASLALPSTAYAATVGGGTPVVSATSGTTTQGGIVFHADCTNQDYLLGIGGIGGGGVSYVVEGVGSAVGAKVRDTQVNCFVLQGGSWHVFSSSYLPGFAAAVVGTFASSVLGTATDCWSVRAFLANGTIRSSGKQCPGSL